MKQKWRGRFVTEEESRPRGIIDLFAELGRDGNEGKAFGILHDHLKREFGGDIMEMIDRLKDHNFGYTPAIWHDQISGNYLVERRNKSGDLHFKASAVMLRVV